MGVGVGKSVGVEGGVNAVVRHCYDNSDPFLSLRTLLPISPLQQVQQRLLAVAPKARPQRDLPVEGREEMLLQQRGEQPNAWEMGGSAARKFRAERREELHDCRKGNICMPRRWEDVQGMSLLNVGVEGVLLLQQREEKPYAWEVGGCEGEKVKQGVCSVLLKVGSGCMWRLKTSSEGDRRMPGRGEGVQGRG